MAAGQQPVAAVRVESAPAATERRTTYRHVRRHVGSWHGRIDAGSGASETSRPERMALCEHRGALGAALARTLLSRTTHASNGAGAARRLGGCVASARGRHGTAAPSRA